MTPTSSENEPQAQSETSVSKPIDPRILLAPEGFVNEWREGLTDEDYHNDMTAIGSTNLRLVLDSPRAFYHRIFLREKQKETEALRIGKLIHTAVLEPGKFKKYYQLMPDFGNLRSPKNREKRDEWILGLPPGVQLIKDEEEMGMISGILNSLRIHPDASLILNRGVAERAGYYRDPETGIRLKVKPDFYSDRKDGVLADLKSCRSGEAREFGNQAYQSRYDLQMYMQAEGIRAITGKFPKFICLIAVEKEPPHESAIFYFPKEALFQAEIDYRLALQKLKNAIDANQWPQRQEAMEQIYVPHWFSNRSVEGF